MKTKKRKLTNLYEGQAIYPYLCRKKTEKKYKYYLFTYYQNVLANK